MTVRVKRATVGPQGDRRRMTNHDRRVQPRVEWTGEAVAAIGTQEVRLRARDLSSGGCRVETQWRPPAGERLGIVLHVDGAPIGAWAEVAWAARQYGVPAESYVWGVRFVEIDHSARLRLEAYVDHCLAVEMLDEMLHGARDQPTPELGASEIDEMQTRIFDAAGGETAAFFPVGGGSGFEIEATSEIDVDSTLTSEVPATHTVAVDIAELYRRAAMAPPAAFTGAMPAPTSFAAAPPGHWEVGPEPVGPEPIGAEPMHGPEGFFQPPPQAWGATSFTPAPTAPAWDVPSAAPPMADFVIEPLAAEPFVPVAPPQAPAAADVGDPFWVEPVAWAEPVATPEPAFPGHAPASWSTPSPAPVQPHYAVPSQDPNAFAKGAPFDAPPAGQRSAFDPQAFDPQAFDPQALQAWPSPAPEPVVATLEAPLSADALLELKRKRIEALLSSVPRRDASASKGGANTMATGAHAAKPEPGAKPRARAVNPDTGLRQLFDQALRDLNRED